MVSPNLMSLKPIIIACQILWILPINKHLETSKLMLFYYVIMNIFYLLIDVLYKISAYNVHSIKMEGNLIIIIMIGLKQILDVVMIVSHVFSLVVRNGRLLKLIKGMKFLESWAATDGVRANRFPLIFILFTSILMTSVISYNKPELYSMHKYTEFLGQLLFGFFISASFSMFVDYMRHHLDFMADSLEPNAKKLSLQVDMSLYIFDLCRLINRIYSVQLLVICFRILINLILSAYFLISVPWLGDKPFAGMNLILISCFAEEMYSLIGICGSCTKMQKAAENFNNKLFNLMSESDDLCSNDKLHLYVTIKQTVHFKACGFFSIEYPLVTSIVATMATYLVILVQFSSPA